MDKLIIFIKYAIINGLLTGAYFLLYYIFIEVFNVSYSVSNIISYVITVIAAYFLTKHFVFKSKKDGKKEFILFIAIRLAMVGISSLGLYIFINLLSVGKYISFIIVNGACFLASFALNKWVFTGKSKETRNSECKDSHKIHDSDTIEENDQHKII